MNWKYFKVILRYGHVGRRREVSVARYLQMDESHNSVSVMDYVSEMPGVKGKGVALVTIISKDEYDRGKSAEDENFYLRNLMTFNPKLQFINGEEKEVC